jgi:hypothetical protein
MLRLGRQRQWIRHLASAEVPTLNNTTYSIVYNIACLNARLKAGADCLAEAWMNRVGGGSVAYFGATVTLATYENHDRAKGIFPAIYESGYTRLGPALARAEEISFLAK